MRVPVGCRLRAKVTFGMHDSLTAIFVMAMSETYRRRGLAELCVSQCLRSQGPWLSAVRECEAAQRPKRLQNWEYP